MWLSDIDRLYDVAVAWPGCMVWLSGMARLYVVAQYSMTWLSGMGVVCIVQC